MESTFRKNMIACAVAALVCAPLWAAGERSADADKGTKESHVEASTALSGAAGRSDSAGDRQLHALTPDELQGKAVIDAAGDDVGKVAQVVSDRETREVFAVLSGGGGSGEIVIPFDELRLAEEAALSISSTRKQLEERDDIKYDKARYVELESGAPISEFSALELEESDAGAKPSGAGKTGASGATSPVR